ncbi:hypothetical protein CFC21_065352 [Triticum aestivum]|uniref:Uncharacterized protein n=3 Tax=Triticum TaxID=4564 RepID=A0A9R0WLV1_TRITD|nr:hypothetical protein CFC21_065352 [Triticum aestivum]VAI16439.1 unnamed protein product [Triticum turgidum subsp. durum]
MSKVEMGEEEQEQEGTAVDDPEKKTNKASAAGTLSLPSPSMREALSLSLREQHHDEEVELKWAAIERLPTRDRLHTSLPLHANATHPLEPVDWYKAPQQDKKIQTGPWGTNPLLQPSQAAEAPPLLLSPLPHRAGMTLEFADGLNTDEKSSTSALEDQHGGKRRRTAISKLHQRQYISEILGAPPQAHDPASASTIGKTSTP